MKNPVSFLIPLLFFFLVSCDKDEAEPSVEAITISNISLMESSPVTEAQEIAVTIYLGTPCHSVKQTDTTVSGTVYTYNFVVTGQENPCIQVVTEEVVKVTFDPAGTGEYTLNFLINGELFETRTVTVTD